MENLLENNEIWQVRTPPDLIRQKPISSLASCFSNHLPNNLTLTGVPPANGLMHCNPPFPLHSVPSRSVSFTSFDLIEIFYPNQKFFGFYHTKKMCATKIFRLLKFFSNFLEVLHFLYDKSCFESLSTWFNLGLSVNLGCITVGQIGWIQKYSQIYSSRFEGVARCNRKFGRLVYWWVWRSLNRTLNLSGSYLASPIQSYIGRFVATLPS